MAISDRGFASMPVDQRRAIASKGGKTAHAEGRAHKWTSEEAKAAAQRSVSVRRARRKQAEAQP